MDLTHSFPSVSGDSSLDYLPSHGFLHKPSHAWPPPSSDDILALAEGALKDLKSESGAGAAADKGAVSGFHVERAPTQTFNLKASSATGMDNEKFSAINPVPGSGRNLSILIDEKLVEIKDQIQIYAQNHLLSHPLVSPVLQPSLGGLPPLLILTGGGEVLRDEQIYLAHKAADPAKYLSRDAHLDEIHLAHYKSDTKKWKPTNVQLQVIFCFL